MKFEVSLSRIQIGEDLRVIEEDVYVPAHPVIDMDHHCGATAKGPEVDNGERTVGLVDQVDGEVEKMFPRIRHAARVLPDQASNHWAARSRGSAAPMAQ